MRAGMVVVAVASVGFFFPLNNAVGQNTSQSMGANGKVHTLIQGIEIPSVSGQPFTAKIDVKWDEPLANGGTESHTYYTLVARDGQGRVRRETRGFVPAGSSDAPVLKSFAINDPVAGTRTTCNVATLQCVVTAFHARMALAAEPAGLLPGGFSTLQRVSLGEQTANDVQVVGTRETITTPAGAHGNTSAVVSSNDEWFSPDLQMDMTVVRTDPHFGTETLTVDDLVRGEPNALWFQVPSNYQVVTATGS